MTRRPSLTLTIPLVSRREICIEVPAYAHVGLRLTHGLSAYEPQEQAAALAYCDLNPGPFYDIGANIGLFSIVVSGSLGRECYAFEPTPDLFASLEATAAKWALPIKSFRIAVSDAKGSAPYFLSGRSDASNSLNPEFREHRGESIVATDTLDNLLVSQPSLIKIDVETMEPAVLAGGSKVLRVYRPSILIEVLPATQDYINTFIQEFNYIAYRVTPHAQWESTRTIDSKRSRSFRN